MKRVAYKDMCVTIFCSNCGAIAIPEVSRDEAKKIERGKEPIHCNTCVVLARRVDQLDSAMRQEASAAERSIRMIEGDCKNKIARFETEQATLRKELAKIQADRFWEMKWKAGNN